MDTRALNGLLAEQFVEISPVGFVLGRQQWMERFGDGVENRAFAVADPKIHEHGTAAVVVSVLDQQTSLVASTGVVYDSGRLRIALTAVRVGRQVTARQRPHRTTTAAAARVSHVCQARAVPEPHMLNVLSPAWCEEPNGPRLRPDSAGSMRVTSPIRIHRLTSTRTTSPTEHDRRPDQPGPRQHLSAGSRKRPPKASVAAARPCLGKARHERVARTVP